MKIIAEIGSNFKSYQDCLDAVTIAKACAADAVKFQLASFDELYGHVINKVPHNSKARQWRDDFNKNFIRKEWLEGLDSHCEDTGIEFMCSAFSLEGYKEVDKYVTTHKIASCENNIDEFHHYVMSTGKAVIISLGVTSPKQLTKIMDKYIDYPAETTLLLCSSKYPAIDMNLDLIDQIIDDYIPYAPASKAMKYGVSDHTLSTYSLPSKAFEMGNINVYEKHFNPFNYTDTPDCGHSVGIAGFGELVSVLSGAEQDLGTYLETEYNQLSHLIKRDIETGFRPLPDDYRSLL